MTLFFEPFKVNGECRGIRDAHSVTEIGVRLAGAVSFRAPAMGAPSRGRDAAAVPGGLRFPGPLHHRRNKRRYANRRHHGDDRPSEDHRDDAALPPGDDVEHVIELVKVGRDVKEPCAGNGPEQRPRRTAIRQPSVYAGTLGQPNREPTAGEHGHREHEPVGVQRNAERQVEENGPHSMVLKRSVTIRCTTLTRCSAKNQCTKLLVSPFHILFVWAEADGRGR